MRRACASLLLLGACASAPPPAPPPQPYAPADATLELHAHLFMKEGLGFIFRGDFNGPLAAKDWTSSFCSQANPETVERSGIGLMVVSLAGYPVLSSPRDAVRREIAMAQQFVAGHPDWIIARSAAEARAALDQGRRALVFALEPNILETEADLEEFVDRDGVRIVTFLHLKDDDNGGAAMLPREQAVLNPGTVLFHSHRQARDRIRVNAHGLTDRGRALAHQLIDRGVWLDVSHASDLSAHELIAMDEAAGVPVLLTHTTLRKYLQAEIASPEWQLQAVARTGGVVGLLPSEDMLTDTVLPPGACGTGCTQPCEGGIHALAQQWREVSAIVPPDDIALGSDYSDGLGHLHPACPVGTELDQAGLWNIGQAGAVWDSLEKLGAVAPHRRRAIVDHFLDAWSKVRPATGASPKPAASP